MKKGFTLDRNGKKITIVVDTTKDTTVYDAQDPHGQITRGIDLLVHESKNENHYYLLYWSRWQNEDDEIKLVSKERANEIVLENLSDLSITDEYAKKLGLVVEEIA